MLKCANCGALVQDRSQACGLCGSNQLYPPSENVQPSASRQLHPQQRRRSTAIAFLTGIVGILVVGIVLIFLPVSSSPYLTIVGALMVMFAIVGLITATGLSSVSMRYGRWGGRRMRKADDALRRREKEEMED